MVDFSMLRVGGNRKVRGVTQVRVFGNGQQRSKERLRREIHCFD